MELISALLKRVLISDDSAYIKKKINFLKKRFTK